MTEQELRESIFYIIMSRKFTDSFGDEMGIDEEIAKQIADALISNGYVVDMPALIDGSMGIFVPNKGSMELYPTSIKEQLSVAERRAEVAEKALKIVCRMQENLNILVDGKPWTKEEIYNRYIEQAEKELAEERKDD